MASIPLSELTLTSVKKSLRDQYPDVRSSHLSEAIAASLRRRTHASLLAELQGLSVDPPIELLDDTLFDKRLQELGYPADPKFSFEYVDKTHVISTFDASDCDIKYKSLREKAWRNLMVLTINAGLQQKLFSLRPNDNRWPDAENREYCLFDFELPNGLPARGFVSDAGWGELSIHGAINPKGNWVRASNAGFNAGDAFAVGWLERKNGAWLQSATTMFNCKKAILQLLADLMVEPMGYGDKGRVIM
ncbi:MAG: hypothetical protein WC856_23635 [Methylococcaceae bacterium]|jgi:hypothetical protein